MVELKSVPISQVIKRSDMHWNNRNFDSGWKQSILNCKIAKTLVEKVHCCMKCPQILREKTSSEKYTVISLKIQWKVFAEGNAFRKCQQIILPLIIINAIIFRGQN